MQTLRPSMGNDEDTCCLSEVPFPFIAVAELC